MATLQGKTIVIVGGSSGIGYAVALASLQSLARTVVIASSSQKRVEDAIQRLKTHNLNFPGEVRGEVLDAKSPEAVRSFAGRIGTVDHIVWTSGDFPKGAIGALPYANADSVEDGQPAFMVRFWGPFVLAKHAKFHPGGSLTLTSGVSGIKPPRGNVLAPSVTMALDGLTRGLAVDLAPIRVNVVNPGAIETELFDQLFGDQRDVILSNINQKILLKRPGYPSEIAEAYLFLMK